MKISTLDNGSKMIDFNKDLVLSNEGIIITDPQFIAGIRNSKLETHNLHMVLFNRKRIKSKLFITWIAIKYIWNSKKC